MRERRNIPFVLLICAGLSSSLAPIARSEIVANHETTSLAQVPAEWIAAARSQLRVSYGHGSHGSQIISGMNVLKAPPGSLYWFDSDGTLGGLSLHDGTPAGDLGTPDRTTWAARTRAMLDDPASGRNVVVWSWSSYANTSPENIQLYLTEMSALEAEYPDVAFVYMTGYVDGTGETGNLHQRNEQIRAHVAATDGVLFDFADIESYDPSGSGFLALGANDACDYSGGNWAVEWCGANPASDLCVATPCAHSESLNCNLKARAFWWMLARLAGWGGPEDPEPIPGLPPVWRALLAVLLLVASVYWRAPGRWGTADENARSRGSGAGGGVGWPGGCQEPPAIQSRTLARKSSWNLSTSTFSATFAFVSGWPKIAL